MSLFGINPVFVDVMVYTFFIACALWGLATMVAAWTASSRNDRE